MIEGEIYDRKRVDFFLEYLNAVEQNASQFHRKSKNGFQPVNLMANGDFSNSPDYTTNSRVSHLNIVKFLIENICSSND